MTMKKVGSLFCYQESGRSLVGDAFLPNTEFPLSTSLHDTELIERMQSHSASGRDTLGNVSSCTYPLLKCLLSRSVLVL